MQNVLEIVKKNMLSIICLLIAILAMVAVWVYPLPGMFAAQQAELEQRKSELDALNALATKERKFPQTDPLQAEQAKLTVFPTRAVIDKAKDLTTAITTQAQQVEEFAMQKNEKQLLVKDSLPEIGSTAADYREAYEKMLDYANADPAIRSQTLPYRVLKAGVPPTPEQVKAEGERRAQEIRDRKLIPGANDQLIADEIARMEANLDTTMKFEVAQKSKMYMAPDALDVYGGVISAAAGGAGAAGGGAAPGGELVSATVYRSQLGLWVQQDVSAALAAANEKSTGILDAPVKHLIKIDVDEDGGRVVTNPGEADTGMPPSVKTPTGRTSGDLYEVIPFRLTINVDATQVPAVLTELSRNRFITVLEVDLAAVDTASRAIEGYMYGSKPVVQLTLACEALFMKSWLSKYIPASIASPPPPPQ